MLKELEILLEDLFQIDMSNIVIAKNPSSTHPSRNRSIARFDGRKFFNITTASQRVEYIVYDIKKFAELLRNVLLDAEENGGAWWSLGLGVLIRFFTFRFRNLPLKLFSFACTYRGIHGILDIRCLPCDYKLLEHNIVSLSSFNIKGNIRAFLMTREEILNCYLDSNGFSYEVK